MHIYGNGQRDFAVHRSYSAEEMELCMSYMTCLIERLSDLSPVKAWPLESAIEVRIFALT